jgi:hypothetical protein
LLKGVPQIPVVFDGPIAAAGSEPTRSSYGPLNSLLVGYGGLLRCQQEINALPDHRGHRYLLLSGDQLDPSRLFICQLNLCSNHAGSVVMSLKVM